MNNLPTIISSFDIYNIVERGTTKRVIYEILQGGITYYANETFPYS